MASVSACQPIAAVTSAVAQPRALGALTKVDQLVAAEGVIHLAELAEAIRERAVEGVRFGIAAGRGHCRIVIYRVARTP
jgi:hypothetical protein